MSMNQYTFNKNNEEIMNLSIVSAKYVAPLKVELHFNNTALN